MKDMTGIERMMASRGLNNSYTHSKRANNPAIPIAQTNEIDMPKIPRSILAPTGLIETTGDEPFAKCPYESGK